MCGALGASGLAHPSPTAGFAVLFLQLIDRSNSNRYIVPSHNAEVHPPEMNNAWSIAIRLPCKGPRSIAAFQWPRSFLILGEHTVCSNAISTSIARQQQQWLSRNFSTVPSRFAKFGKRNVKPRREEPRPSLEKNASASLPPTSKPAESPSGKPAQEREKAQVHLSQTQVASILGPGLTFDQGMELLQELQYRRVTGSLSDKGIDFPGRSEFTRDHCTRALEWLRDTYPVDEEAAAAEYAEELAEALRKELEERARSLRLYKKVDAEAEESKEQEDIYIDEHYDKIPLREDQTRDITSESALMARKEYVEASRKKAKIEAEKEAAEREARGEKPPEAYKGQALVLAKQTAIADASKKKHERWEKLKQEAELKEEDLFADRSAFSRLWAPTLLGLTVVGLSWAYAESYEPPKSSMRIFPSISPAAATIFTLAGINLALVVLWRHPSAWKMMNRNFLLSPGHPHAFSIVGSLFSHQQFSHWMWNMSMLYVIGIPLHEEVGRGAFLSIYLSSGVLGYLTSLTFNVLTKSYLSATLGASAAIFGLVGAYFTISETRKLNLPKFMGGEIEYSSWLPLATIIVWELVRWRMNRFVIDGVNGGTDYLTHLGGVSAGAFIGWVLRKRLEAERAEDELVRQTSGELSASELQDIR
ncbi:uncharacterized protein PV09_02501 [Verruconis gallopava]|uniref:Peptidase S54 rhomboid domain-containing protein n=1 Tax=Verruconis gallopava TaxID=253628 RepID=A0A0D1XVJ2_9PEZI|nr:uncharacterized protein PV09_02501 [Verruconis gallopava]KIW06821.1 hypothetical protein PV09_02501 [Verruconis gallopava]